MLLHGSMEKKRLTVVDSFDDVESFLVFLGVVGLGLRLCLCLFALDDGSHEPVFAGGLGEGGTGAVVVDGAHLGRRRAGALFFDIGLVVLELLAFTFSGIGGGEGYGWVVGNGAGVVGCDGGVEVYAYSGGRGRVWRCGEGMVTDDGLC